MLVTLNIQMLKLSKYQVYLQIKGGFYYDIIKSSIYFCYGYDSFMSF